MASKFWLSLCLVLFAYNLIDLISNRYQLSLKIVEESDVFFDKDFDLNYLVCTPFSNIKEENSLTFERATQKVSVKSFLNYSIASIESRLNVVDLFHLNESLIFNQHVCFPTTKSLLEKGEEKKKPFNRFLKEYSVFSIFIYSKEKQPNFYERTYEKNDRLGSIYIRAYKQKVFGANYLLNADCSDRVYQIHHDRFTCLNRCFKKLKMNNGFYRFDDEGTFDLNEILEEKGIMKRELNDKEEPLGILEKLPTPSAVEGAEDCLKNCPERACFWEVMITQKIKRLYYKNYLEKENQKKVDLQLNTYAAFYSMNDFHLQLFGLLALFTGTSVFKPLHALLSLALPVAARKIEPLLKNEKLLKIFRLALPNLKHILTLLCFAFILTQGLAMINEFSLHPSHPNRISAVTFSSEPFSVVICFPRYRKGSSSLRKLSFHSIEEATKRLFTYRIKSIDVYAGIQRIEPKFHISDEVLFKSSEYPDGLWLSRCFRVDFHLDERFRKMPLTYLQIEFNTTHKEMFLIERHQNFTSGLVNFRGLFYPQKVTKIYSKSSVKSNCRDYSGEEGCGSRRNCLDRCLSTRFIERHGSIPMNIVVSSSHLNSTWLKRSVYFNRAVDEGVQSECSSIFNQTDCNEVRFEESLKLANDEVSTLVFIRLSYMNIVERQLEYELVKTLLDIISLVTIVFGWNVLRVLTTVLLFLYKISRFKWRKTYRVFLLLLASVGFLVHNVLVFRTIISGDLHENEFFEKPEQYTLPIPILCFQFGTVDENHRKTGEYLDDLTAKMTFQHIFRAIRFNNRTYEKNLFISRLNFTKSSNFYSSPELELSHFYCRGLKCFKISLKVNYREEDFLFLADKNVLKIYLNRTFANLIGQTFILVQQADSREIGGGFNYSIGKRIHHPNSHYRYIIEFEQFRIVQEDQFELLKDPRRLFQERVKVNDAKTEEAIRRRFEENHNRTTDDLPLDEHFDVEIDNDLYMQQAKIVTEHAPFRSRNFERNIANIYTNFYYAPFENNRPHFTFSFSFLVRQVLITNRENYTKLVVSVLNSLSLWLDICILDMGAWLIRFLRLALHVYHLLVRIKNRLICLRIKNRKRIASKCLRK